MIGVFDSGSGGLTVLSEIRKRLPSADVLYFGDIKNAPYGSKSREELSLLTVHAIQLLYDRGAENIVSACNSVSASLALSLFDTVAIASDHLIEMVGPTVRYFKDSNARILVAATSATIDSGIYQNAFHMLGKEVQTLTIPELAGAIEFGAPEADIEKIIADAFAPFSPQSFDILLLGCTHYPLVLQSFQQVLGNQVVIFDPAIAVAERVEKQFLSQEAGKGTTRFILSKDSDHFRAFAAKLFPKNDFIVEVVK